MALPIIRGVIDRRILVNYRVDPIILAQELPAPFRPRLVAGFGLAGICLIRLKQIRPAGLPPWFGIASENAAHRVAVEWDEAGATRSGVYIGRRDTGSWANAAAGGRIFPGVHHHATFSVRETAERFEVSLRSDDGQVQVAVCGRIAAEMPSHSVLGSLDEASEFFRCGALGYSPGSEPGCFQGLELRLSQWSIEPLALESISSSYFDDRSKFPAGSVEFDSALLMRGIPHEWHAVADLHAPRGANEPASSASKHAVAAR